MVKFFKEKIKWNSKAKRTGRVGEVELIKMAEKLYKLCKKYNLGYAELSVYHTTYDNTTVINATGKVDIDFDSYVCNDFAVIKEK